MTPEEKEKIRNKRLAHLGIPTVMQQPLNLSAAASPDASLFSRSSSPTLSGARPPSPSLVMRNRVDEMLASFLTNREHFLESNDPTCGYYEPNSEELIFNITVPVTKPLLMAELVMLQKAAAETPEVPHATFNYCRVVQSNSALQVEFRYFAIPSAVKSLALMFVHAIAALAHNEHLHEILDNLPYLPRAPTSFDGWEESCMEFFTRLCPCITLPLAPLLAQMLRNGLHQIVPHLENTTSASVKFTIATLCPVYMHELIPRTMEVLVMDILHFLCATQLLADWSIIHDNYNQGEMVPAVTVFNIIKATSPPTREAPIVRLAQTPPCPIAVQNKHANIGVSYWQNLARDKTREIIRNIEPAVSAAVGTYPVFCSVIRHEILKLIMEINQFFESNTGPALTEVRRAISLPLPDCIGPEQRPVFVRWLRLVFASYCEPPLEIEHCGLESRVMLRSNTGNPRMLNLRLLITASRMFSILPMLIRKSAENRVVRVAALPLSVDNRCPICLENLIEDTLDPCGHPGCNNCLKMIINTRLNCHLCRSIVHGLKKKYPVPE